MGILTTLNFPAEYDGLNLTSPGQVIIIYGAPTDEQIAAVTAAGGTVSQTEIPDLTWNDPTATVNDDVVEVTETSPDVFEFDLTEDYENNVSVTITPDDGATITFTNTIYNPYLLFDGNYGDKRGVWGQQASIFGAYNNVDGAALWSASGLPYSNYCQYSHVNASGNLFAIQMNSSSFTTAKAILIDGDTLVGTLLATTSGITRGSYDRATNIFWFANGNYRYGYNDSGALVGSVEDTYPGGLYRGAFGMYGGICFRILNTYPAYNTYLYVNGVETWASTAMRQNHSSGYSTAAFSDEGAYFLFDGYINPGGTNYYYLVKFDLSGTFQWSTSFSGGLIVDRGIYVNKHGNSVVTQQAKFYDSAGTLLKTKSGYCRGIQNDGTYFKGG